VGADNNTEYIYDATHMILEINQGVVNTLRAIEKRVAQIVALGDRQGLSELSFEDPITEEIIDAGEDENFELSGLEDITKEEAEYWIANHQSDQNENQDSSHIKINMYTPDCFSVELILDGGDLIFTHDIQFVQIFSAFEALQVPA
jgi:hypothetical protein